MARDETFHVAVVTPEGSVLEGEAVSAVFPAHDGEYGILPHHAPLLSLLGIGELRVTRPGGGVERLYVDGGFAQFVDDRLTLVTEDAKPLPALDPAAPARLLAEARALRAAGEHEPAVVEAAFERARVQRRLVDRRPSGSGR